jgi:hypothetical protein
MFFLKEETLGKKSEVPCQSRRWEANPNLGFSDFCENDHFSNPQNLEEFKAYGQVFFFN